MDKSYVTLEQKVCDVCGKTYDTNAILMDKRLRNRFEMHTVTGWGMCPEHKALADGGMIALVEVSSVPEGDRMTREEAYRTGKMVHLKRDAWDKLFNVAAPVEPMAFVAEGTIDKLVELIGETVCA